MSELILSDYTIKILRNFSDISPGMRFKRGHVLTSIAPSKSIYGKAEIPELIPDDFAIADVPKFLTALSLFDSPKIEVGEKSLFVENDKLKLKYVFTNPENIIGPPEKELTMNNVKVNFEMKADALSKLQKALGILSQPEIAIVGDGENIFLETFNTKSVNSNKFSVNVGITPHKFKFIFKTENFKLIPDNYQVSVSIPAVTKFVGSIATYWVAMEKDSKFTE